MAGFLTGPMTMDREQSPYSNLQKHLRALKIKPQRSLVVFMGNGRRIWNAGIGILCATSGFPVGKYCGLHQSRYDWPGLRTPGFGLEKFTKTCKRPEWSVHFGQPFFSRTGNNYKFSLFETEPGG